jgi:hypothetical protein
MLYDIFDIRQLFIYGCFASIQIVMGSYLHICSALLLAAFECMLTLLSLGLYVLAYLILSL